MTHLELARALSGLRPGAQWSLAGDDYSGLTWVDTVQTMPTLDEITTYLASIAYVPLRVAAYPPITDQLDAIMKGGQALADMQARCMAVKAQFPKPQGGSQ